MRQQLAEWWTKHSPRLAELPKRRDLNRVRTEFLDTFVKTLGQSGSGVPPLSSKLNTGETPVPPCLDRFKLAGVIATWWTETLPDFKTLLENGFPGVMDGWVDAIADAVEDDEAAGPAFDPFGHKLVRRTMTDYLERIAAAKADIARLKGDKEAFEQSNAPADADEEELAAWNYAKDLESQTKEAKNAIKEKLQAGKPLTEKLKSVNKSAQATQKAIAVLEGNGPKSIARASKTGLPTAELEQALRKHKTAAHQFDAEVGKLEAELVAIQQSCQPENERIATIEDELKPYEAIKEQLSEGRARYRTLTDEFVNELKSRCGMMNDDQKRALVLELFAQDVQAGLNAAMAEKRQELVRFIEGLWDKYRVTLAQLRGDRAEIEASLSEFLKQLGYA